MKPKDLKSPYRWENRQVTIENRVWYIPDFLETYGTFQFPGWSDPLVFGNENPVNVEYCSGNGCWIINKAKEHPNVNWVAVEKKFARVRKIWSKANNEGIKNLIMICGEALTATRNYFPTGSVSNTYINFPDPWPKRRHAKHRLIAPPFVEELHRIMQSKGDFTFVTDDPDTSTLCIEEMQQHLGFQSCFPEPFFVHELECYGTSYFEELWREKGKAIHYHRFQRI